MFDDHRILAYNSTMIANIARRAVPKQAFVWRHLANAVLEGDRSTFSQQEIAAELGLSKAHVHHAIAPLRGTGAVEVPGKRLVVRDVRKILLHWAVNRRPERDQILWLFSSATPAETVAMCPPKLAFTSFAGFVRRFEQQPAPYSTVRAYADPTDGATLQEVERRFMKPEGSVPANVVIHAADEVLARQLPHVVSPAQLYVDLWNESDPFAIDYLRDLDRRYHLA